MDIKLLAFDKLIGIIRYNTNLMKTVLVTTHIINVCMCMCVCVCLCVCVCVCRGGTTSQVGQVFTWPIFTELLCEV